MIFSLWVDYACSMVMSTSKPSVVGGFILAPLFFYKFPTFSVKGETIPSKSKTSSYLSKLKLRFAKLKPVGDWNKIPLSVEIHGHHPQYNKYAQKKWEEYKKLYKISPDACIDCGELDKHLKKIAE